MHVTKNSDYIKQLQEEFKNCNFTRIERHDGMYITNDINRRMGNDYRIFKESQVKRILRGYGAPFVSKDVKNKLSYFSQNEDKDLNTIYKYDCAQNLDSEEYAIQNIGHATQLIQIPGFNILTDPIFNSLSWLLYPAKTESHPSIEELPKIDVIIISHNHRDHTDRHSLQKLLQKHREKDWPQPQIFVPMGDKKLFEKTGFIDVQEVEWYTKIFACKDVSGVEKTVNFINIPADHRSGRTGIDHHKSLVNGWIINPEQGNVIFKFSGDTRSLSKDNQEAVDATLWYEIKNKLKNKGRDDNIEIPHIICFEPSGPNYTRSDMDVTHQSTSYSVLLKFVEAENLAKLSGYNSLKFLQKIKTFMIHHKKFEFGPDRFNEGLFLFKKMFQYLDLNDADLKQELTRQKRKLELNLDKEKLKKNLPFTSRPIISTLPEHTSFLVRAKDFIIMEITSMINTDIDKLTIKDCLLKNTIFAKIGERLTNNEIGNRMIDVECIQKYTGKSK